MIPRSRILQCSAGADSLVPDGYVECTVGDFAVEQRWSRHVTFTEDDATILARLAIALAGTVPRLLVAFHPWAQEAWKLMSAEHWTTVHALTFKRRGLFGFGGDNPSVVGYAHDQMKLVDVLQWAWTLPGRDTLLTIPAQPDQVTPLMEAFEDDREDDGSNEVRLLQWSGHHLTWPRGSMRANRYDRLQPKRPRDAGRNLYGSWPVEG